MQRQVITSGMVAPRERLPFLIEQFGREMQRVDWRPAGHIDPLEVRASCTFAVAGDVRLADIRWSSGKVSPASTANDGTFADHLILFRERQRSGWYELADGTVHRTAPGSIMLYPAEQTFVAGGVPAEYDFDFQIAMVPRTTLTALGLPGNLPHTLHLSPGRPFNDLISSYMADWARLLPDLDVTRATAATRTLVNLLSVAQGTLDARSPEAQRDFSVARVRSARRYISENLANAALSPAHVAAALGISVRQLHLDFESTGVTVARTILAERVQMAQRLLVEKPHLTIIEIAFASGFDAVSTFYRVFKTQTGTTASDYRRELVGQKMQERRQGRMN